MNEKKLYKWFRESNVKDIPAPIGIHLIDVAKEIASKLGQIEDQELCEELKKYRDALVTVLGFSTIQQEAIIGKLEKLKSYKKTGDTK